ncbi:MAG: ATP-dependent helicase [Brevinema sp.]
MNDLFSGSLFDNQDNKQQEQSQDNFADFLKNVELEEETPIAQPEEEAPSLSTYRAPYHNYNSIPTHYAPLPADFLDLMNDEQKKAVLHDEGSLLILAGAGSGKTRVITHRFAQLIHKHNLKIHNILCVTFTNKAAGEMKERISGLLGVNMRMSWVKTFHSMCTMILRDHAHRIGFSQEFTIYDSADTKNTIKKIMERLNIDPAENMDKIIIRAIGSAKEELILPDQMEKNARNPLDITIAQVYKEYQSILKQNQAMDFGDLIINTIALLENCPDVRQQYQEQWHFVMADEFQDTNKPQYHLLRLLSRNLNNVCVVGDDDQSIYGWRGARVENIRQFQEEFHADVIRLEKNYRSHGTILEAANAIVKSIKGRMPKTLKAVREKGEKIIFRSLYNDREQASYVYEQMQSLIAQGKNYKDIAILYRTNAQSRVLEEMLTRHQIPFKIYGGQRFYDRAEVKDILCYLRLIVNPRDAEAFDRIVNVPKRKIGDVSKAKLTEFMQFAQISYPEMCLQAHQINGLGKAVADSLLNLGKILQELKETAESTAPTQVIKILVESIQYFDAYLVPRYGTHEAEDRFNNIQELVNAVKVFEEANPNSMIADFLREASLLSSLHEEEVEDENVVSLMTIHSAKGLEFPVVFVVGIAEGLLPLSSARDDKDLDEEKRLFYVAITRAMDKLYLTYEQQSMRYGDIMFNDKSHFIDAIPVELLDMQKPSFKSQERDNFTKSYKYSEKGGRSYGKSSYQKQGETKRVKDTHSVQDALSTTSAAPVKAEKIKDISEISVGDRVLHPMFGQGSVKTVSKAMAMVDFDNFSSQPIMKSAIPSLKKVIS